MDAFQRFRSNNDENPAADRFWAGMHCLADGLLWTAAGARFNGGHSGGHDSGAAAGRSRPGVRLYGTRSDLQWRTKLQRYHSLPADIYVNNVKIGTVNPKEAMVFDVAPGRYSFSWMIYNQKVGWGEEMRPEAFDLSGGTNFGILAEYAGSTTYFVTGAVLRSLPGVQGRLAPDIKVVRAVHCPPTICI